MTCCTNWLRVGLPWAGGRGGCGGWLMPVGTKKGRAPGVDLVGDEGEVVEERLGQLTTAALETL